MSKRHRQRICCRQCQTRAQVDLLEVMTRRGDGRRRHWIWSQLELCGTCQRGLINLVDQLAIRRLNSSSVAPTTARRGVVVRRGAAVA